MRFSFFALFVFVLLSACGEVQQPTMEASVSATAPAEQIVSPFSGKLPNYWYQGKAEISVYDLEQARYGQMREGVATMIQVSEDFLTDKQVKNDNYSNPNSTSIIKTNLIKRFTTGVYDYSIMSSVFTPTDLSKFPHTLKVSMSAQDWCGQTFAQLNYRSSNDFAMQWRSYFEREADQNEALAADWIEDELFNRLRIDPRGVPTGNQMILPAMDYLALVHKPVQAVKAICTQGPYAGADFSGKDLEQYQIEYPTLDRVLTVVYEAAAPYEIAGWTETRPSRGRELTTKATLRKRVLEPYWGQNSNEYAGARKELGL